MRVLHLLTPVAALASQLSSSGHSAGQQWARDGLVVEEINLDEPPSERWRGFAQRHKKEIVSRCQTIGQMYKFMIGEDIAQRFVRGATPPPELLVEMKGMVEAVGHNDVTLDCLLLADMWQAVDAPGFECTGLLAAMENGTVIHGRNIDYDNKKMLESSMKAGTGMPKTGIFEGKLMRGGKPIAIFLAQMGSLGSHTGMRLGAYSVNSNARIKNDRFMDNLVAHEAGAKNFPWVIRQMLQNYSDFASAVRFMETTDLNAPNYFIFAGAGPYEGAVVTKDRLFTHEPTTPPTQRLNASAGIWHLVQTNDDLLSPPEDSRRGSALLRLSQSRQSSVSMSFVENEMQTAPIKNSDTLLTWVSNPLLGTHTVLVAPQSSIVAGATNKWLHKALHIPMPQDLESRTGKKAGSFLSR